MRLKKVFSIFQQSKLLNQIVVYSTFMTLQKAIPFLLIPLFSRIFTKEEMGFYTLYQALYNILIPVVTLSLDSALGVVFFKLDKERFAIYLTNILLFSFVLFLFFITLSLIFGNWLTQLLNFPFPWLLLIVIAVLPQFLINILLALYRNQQQPFKYGFLACFSSLVTISISLIFVFMGNMSWKGMILGLLFGNSIVALFCLFQLWRNGFIMLKKSYVDIRDAFSFSLPVTFHCVGGWLSNSLNRVLINSLIGAAATGSYGVGATFGMVMTLLQDSFNKAFAPFLFEKLKYLTEINKFKIVQVSMLMYLIIFLAAILLSCLGYYLVDFFFGQAYIETRLFIIPLVASAAISGFYKIHVNYLFFSKKTMELAKITFIGGLINIVLAYIMIKYWGLIGAAYSAFIMQLAVYLMVVYKTLRLYDLHWKYNMGLVLKSGFFGGGIGKS